jgi:colicin import membrane protein
LIRSAPRSTNSKKCFQTSRRAKAAEQRAEQERLASIRRQEEAVEQARLAEVARANAAADEILRQQKARQADVAHKSKILGEAKQALIGMNISEELAKAIVLKIARGEVPHITIQF